MAGSQVRADLNDTSPEAMRAQSRMYRAMSPGAKLELVFQTYRTGKELAMAGIRMRHSEAGEAEVRRLWAQQHLGPKLFDAAYGALSRE